MPTENAWYCALKALKEFRLPGRNGDLIYTVR